MLFRETAKGKTEIFNASTENEPAMKIKPVDRDSVEYRKMISDE